MHSDYKNKYHPSVVLSVFLYHPFTHIYPLPTPRSAFIMVPSSHRSSFFSFILFLSYLFIFLSNTYPYSFLSTMFVIISTHQSSPSLTPETKIFSKQKAHFHLSLRLLSGTKLHSSYEGRVDGGGRDCTRCCYFA